MVLNYSDSTLMFVARTTVTFWPCILCRTRWEVVQNRSWISMTMRDSTENDAMQWNIRKFLRYCFNPYELHFFQIQDLTNVQTNPKLGTCQGHTAMTMKIALEAHFEVSRSDSPVLMKRPFSSVALVLNVERDAISIVNRLVVLITDLSLNDL